MPEKKLLTLVIGIGTDTAQNGVDARPVQALVRNSDFTNLCWYWNHKYRNFEILVTTTSLGEMWTGQRMLP